MMIVSYIFLFLFSVLMVAIPLYRDSSYTLHDKYVILPDGRSGFVVNFCPFDLSVIVNVPGKPKEPPEGADFFIGTYPSREWVRVWRWEVRQASPEVERSS